MKQLSVHKILNHFFSIIVLLIFFGISSASSKEYVIGVEAVSYSPLFDFSSGDTSRPSYSKALLSRFFEHKGYKFKLLPLPIKRFDKWYVEEAIDFKFPDNVRWRKGISLKLDITYSEPAMHLVAGTYVLKKNEHLVRKDIKSLATIFGFYPTLWYDRLTAGTLSLQEEHSPYGVVKHLLHGNVDAINIDYNVIRKHLKLQGASENSVVLSELVHHEPYAYHLSSIKYPEIIKEFNDFLTDNPDVIKSLKKKFNIIEPSHK